MERVFQNSCQLNQHHTIGHKGSALVGGYSISATEVFLLCLSLTGLQNTRRSVQPTPYLFKDE